MRKFELLKKAIDFGVREGLGVLPLAEVLPVRMEIGQTLREGTQEEEEKGKMDESTQPPPPDMTSAPTQPPSTTTAQAPILTLAATASMPPPTDKTPMPPMTQTLIPTMETVSVHNIEIKSDQEEEHLVGQQPLGGDKEQNQPEDSQDERLILTP